MTQIHPYRHNIDNQSILSPYYSLPPSLFFYLDFLRYANGVRRSFYSVQKSHNFEDIFQRGSVHQKLQLGSKNTLSFFTLIFWNVRTVYDDRSTPFRNLIILKIFFRAGGLLDIDPFDMLSTVYKLK